MSFLLAIPSASRYGKHSGMVVVLGSLNDVLMAVNSRWLNFLALLLIDFCLRLRFHIGLWVL